MTTLPLSTAVLSEKKRKEIFGRKNWTWTLQVEVDKCPEVKDGKISFPAGTPFEVKSNFAGKFELSLFPNLHGESGFDRVTYREGEGVATVTWGYNHDGTICIVLVKEARPAADIIEQYKHCVENHGGYDHVMFAHSPLGFATDVAIRKSIGSLIDYDHAAKGETQEELGASAIIDIFTPECDAVSFNPSFGQSWSRVRYVQVDLKYFSQPKLDKEEIITGFSILSLHEVMVAIAKGYTEDNACVAEGVGCAVLSKFIMEVLVTPIEKWRKLHPPK